VTESEAVGPDGEIAGYRVQSLLGEGGMGVVYLAQRPSGGLCALKVLSRRAMGEPEAAARFEREVRHAAALEHPHLLELYDSGETSDGRPFFAMQYVAGADLGVVLRRDGPLGVSRALSILGQIASGLDSAHAIGLIHRDVKPSNILVAEGGDHPPHAYLADFGLSKQSSQDSIELTKQGQFVGTTAYTAPEEILGRPRDQLIDVYSLGCVLYEALVGEPPFVREHEIDVMYAHLGDPRPSVHSQRAELSVDLDRVIATAMAIDPAERYGTCAELIAAAQLAAGGDSLVPGRVDAPGGEVAQAGDVATPAEASPNSAVGAAASPDRSLGLVVRSGPAAGRTVAVDGVVALGRLMTLEGEIATDRGISRRHASLRREADGSLVVVDEDSANGTFVNGERIEGRRGLAAGDELRMGRTTFEVVALPVPDSTPGDAAPLDAGLDATTPDAQAAAEGSASARITLHVEVDLNTGEIAVAVQDGAAARVVRDGSGWTVQVP
jgi:hypothetical protein